MRLRVADILEAIARIDRYVEGLTFEQFQADQKSVDAVIRNLEVSEAMNRVCADAGDQPNAFVTAVGRRVLERTDW